MSPHRSDDPHYNSVVFVSTSPSRMWGLDNYAQAVARRLRDAGYVVVLDETAPQPRGVCYRRHKSLPPRHRILEILLDEFEAGVHVVNEVFNDGHHHITIGHEGDCPSGEHHYITPSKRR